MKKSIVLNSKSIGQLGNASLIGKHYEEGVTEMELIFLQSSLQHREKQGGPDYWTVWEHNIPCLLSDVIWLMEQGVKVSTRTIER